MKGLAKQLLSFRDYLRTLCHLREEDIYVPTHHHAASQATHVSPIDLPTDTTRMSAQLMGRTVCLVGQGYLVFDDGSKLELGKHSSSMTSWPVRIARSAAITAACPEG